MIRALVFDFDGIILETEMPAYTAWSEIYREHGHELPLDRWLDYVGREAGYFDALGHLESLVGTGFDRETVRARRERRRSELLDTLDVMAGIRDYVSQGRRLGLRLGVASSSSRDYVTRHLVRLGLADQGFSPHDLLGRHTLADQAPCLVAPAVESRLEGDLAHAATA